MSTKHLTPPLRLAAPLLALALTAPCLPAADLWIGEHGDLLGVGYEGGALHPHIHLEGAEVIVGGMVTTVSGEFQSTDIIVNVPQSTFDFIDSIGGRPADAAWDLTGAAAAENFWFLPQEETGTPSADGLGAPWAGVGTEELEPAVWPAGSSDIMISLTGASMPAGGNFSLWQDGATPNFFMSTADAGADQIIIGPEMHSHFNWGFTEPGTYELTFEFSGTHSVDGLSTESATYTFNVVPEPSVTLLGVFALAGLARRRR
jgi:surface-anchored protein